jgi:glycerophosphoryl diester phosphodiesterase
MAAEFPATLPVIPRVAPEDYMDQAGKEADVMHNKLADEVEALAAVVGVTGSLDAASVEARLMGPLNKQVTASRVLEASDSGKMLVCDSLLPIVLYIPDDSGVFGMQLSSDRIKVMRVGPGSLSFSALPGVQLRGVPVRIDRYKTATIIRVSTNLWAWETESDAVPRWDMTLIAHRGGAGTLTEETVATWQWAYDEGCRNLEADIHALADGTLVAMHDDTVDRVTNGTGAVASLTTAQFKALKMNPSTYLGSGYADEPPALLSELLDIQVDDSTVYWLEGKSGGACNSIAAALKSRGIPLHRAVINSFTLSELAGAITAGFDVMYAVTPSTAVWGDIKTAGVEYVGANFNDWTTAHCEAALAEGLLLAAWNLTRKSDYNLARSMGITRIFTDEPFYLNARPAPMNVDFWSEGKYRPGVLSSESTLQTQPNRGYLENSSYGFKQAFNADNVITTYQGWASPIKSDDRCDDFSMSFKLRFGAFEGTSRWIGFFVCANTDEEYATARDPCAEGYNILFRQVSIDIYSVNSAGSSTLLLSVPLVSNLAINVDYDCTIVVTPTTISASNVTLAKTNTVTDSTYRGGHWHISCRGCDAFVKSMHIL